MTTELMKSDKPVSPHGPFTQVWTVNFVVTVPGEEPQIAQAEVNAAHGRLMDQDDATDLLKVVRQQVIDNLPEGTDVKFMDRNEFIRRTLNEQFGVPLDLGIAGLSTVTGDYEDDVLNQADVAASTLEPETEPDGITD